MSVLNIAAAILAICISSSIALAAVPAQAKPPLELRIDPTVTYGVWDGWGTSLCWMGKVFGDRDDIADFLFSTKTTSFKGQSVPGLGLNIARYNAGACSDNTIDGHKMKVSKIIMPYRQMDGFWLDGKSPNPASSSWNWNADANQRLMLLKARERGANRFELFSNSPMWWMCAADNPSGAARASANNLPDHNYQKFAVYLAVVAQAAKTRWGVAFTSIEPFNEPVSDWWFADCKQEGCHVSREAQQKILPLLKAELVRLHLPDLAIAASDENTYDQAIDTWQGFSKETQALVSQINVHGYQYGGGRRDALQRLAVVESHKKLWNSEYGDGDGSGLEMARNLHRDMRWLHPTAWCYWQPADAGGWGLLDCRMEKAEVRSVNAKAYMLAQYSRHIRPGMTLVGSGSEAVVAAFSPQEKRLVLVAFNDGPARTMRIDLSGFTVPDGALTRALTTPKGRARYERQPDLAVQGRRFEVELPADSVETFEVKGASCTSLGADHAAPSPP
ncbi:MAG: glycoside hydrolase [Verrucomicrobiota bacterium]